MYSCETVEHKLQMVHDLQTHALPDSPDELTRCAIRLGYPPEDRQGTMAAFLKDHQSHTALVNGLFKEFMERPDRLSDVSSGVKKLGKRWGAGVKHQEGNAKIEKTLPDGLPYPLSWAIYN